MRFIISVVAVTLIPFFCSSQNAYSIPHDYNQPIYSPDFNMIDRVMSSRQNVYNQNFRVLSDKVAGIYNLINRVEQKNGLTNEQADYANWFGREIAKISKWDFSVQENYYNVYNWLEKVENRVIKWF